MSDGFIYGPGDDPEGSYVPLPDPSGLLVLQDDAEPTAAANTIIDSDYLVTYAGEVGRSISASYTITQIEQAILRGMSRFEQAEPRFYGARSSDVQNTAFPRDGFWAGYARDNYTPLIAKQAVALYAMAELGVDPDELPAAEDTQIKRKKEKVGSLERETEYFEGADAVTIYTEAERLVAKLVGTGGAGRYGQVRLERA